MRIIIGCESSGAVRDAFNKLGHEAVSCDLLPTEKPGPHIVGDIMQYLGECQANSYKGWDLGIFHPPCTYICSSGLHWNKRRPGRSDKTTEALHFVAGLMNSPIHYKAIENPVGCISTRIQFDWGDGKFIVLPEPDKARGLAASQYIQPWQYGHPESKKTGLWLQNLPLLTPTNYIDPEKYRCKCGHIFEGKLGKYGCCDYPAKPIWDNQTASGQNKLPPSEDRWKERSKTYPGIAAAMAQQWGDYIEKYPPIKTTLF